MAMASLRSTLRLATDALIRAADRRPAVLLVESERGDRDRYAAALLAGGFIPIAVSTAREALAIAPRVDAIVTGVLLPGPMDGIALVAALKRDDRTKRIPVVALTRCGWDSERDRAFGAGCDLFLSKPCPPSLLARELRRLEADAAHPLRQSHGVA